MSTLRASHGGSCVRDLSLLGLPWVAPDPHATTNTLAAESGIAVLRNIDSANAFNRRTFNILYDNFREREGKWANRFDAEVDLISKQDLIGLQEVTAEQWKTQLAMLPEFDFYGVGRDGSRRHGECVPTGIRKSRLVATERGYSWLSNDPEKVGVAGRNASLPSSCVWKLTEDRGPVSIGQLPTLDLKTSASRYASDHLPVQVVVSWVQSDVTVN